MDTGKYEACFNVKREQRVYWKQPVYLFKVGVRSANTLSRQEVGITFGMLLFSMKKE